MADYNLVIKASAAKALERIEKKTLRRLVGRIAALAGEPRPQDSEKLSGAERYRIRQGEYRVVYGIDDSAKIVEVVKIGHRRDVYRP